MEKGCEAGEEIDVVISPFIMLEVVTLRSTIMRRNILCSFWQRKISPWCHFTCATEDSTKKGQ